MFWRWGNGRQGILKISFKYILSLKKSPHWSITSPSAPFLHLRDFSQRSTTPSSEFCCFGLQNGMHLQSFASTRTIPYAGWTVVLVSLRIISASSSALHAVHITQRSFPVRLLHDNDDSKQTLPRIKVDHGRSLLISLHTNSMRLEIMQEWSDFSGPRTPIQPSWWILHDNPFETLS